jgi:hypothetical protein
LHGQGKWFNLNHQKEGQLSNLNNYCDSKYNDRFWNDQQPNELVGEIIKLDQFVELDEIEDLDELC